jgi:hypothetical protein
MQQKGDKRERNSLASLLRRESELKKRRARLFLREIEETSPQCMKVDSRGRQCPRPAAFVTADSGFPDVCMCRVHARRTRRPLLPL